MTSAFCGGNQLISYIHMKRTLLFLLGFVLAWGTMQAAVSFDADTKYRLTCNNYGTGSLVLGSNHGSTAYLYYDTSSSYSDDSWWYIREEGSGYNLINAQSGEYITYSSTRIEDQAKGLILTESSEGSASQWIITNYNGSFVIQSVYASDQWFNVRLDGTYLVGTYSGTGSSNELFAIYDSNGNQVTDGGSTGGGTTTGGEVSDDFTDNQGYTSFGEYWERTGLSQPVVYTTDTTDPVLYSIVNLRQNQYVTHDNSSLTQTAYGDSRAKFYFVQSGDNVQVYTEDGYYVSTSYTTDMESRSGLTVSYGTASGNVWAFEWYESSSYPGYSVAKMDNLSSSTGGQTGPGGWGGGGGWGQSQQSSYIYWNDYSGSYVGLYDLDDGGTFVFTSSDSRHVDWLKENGIIFDGSLPSKVSFTTAVDSLRLADKQLVYDQTSKGYFYPLPSPLRNGGDFTAKLTWKMKTGYDTLSVVIDGIARDPVTHEITIPAPSCASAYPLQLVDSAGTVRAATTLQFTYLPLVEVNVSSCNGSYYTQGTIRVTYADVAGHDSTYIAAYKWRGATAQGYAKKAYSIKLRDENGNSVDRKFLGLRNDNNWILDAMATDNACMRNRVSTDLWNDFSVKPYYYDRESKARTGTRGKFVEVFYNGKYHGIYCMTEKLDRKQLKLQKYVSAAESTTGEEEIHGVLYKSAQWSYEVLMGHEQDSRTFPLTNPSGYSNTLGVETWSEFEIKYPDYEDEAVDWEPLYNAVKFVATSNQLPFEQGVKDYFDYPMLKDYYLFLDLLLATDNHGKNMFYYAYDKQGPEGNLLGVAPWDLDGVFGQRWDKSTSYTSDATQDLDDFLWAHEHGQVTYYYRLNQSSTLNWSEELAARYAELRPGYFEPDNLANRFIDYADLFEQSNALAREEDRWPTIHSSIASSVDYAAEWVRSRVAALDEKYGFDPVASAINDAQSEAYFHALGGQGSIAVNCGKAQTVHVYGLDGKLVRSAELQRGFNAIQGLGAGVYIVNGEKVIVK